MHSDHSAQLDRTGVIASISCAVHCMIAPLIVLLAPALGGIWVHPGVHLAIASLVLPVAGLALRKGFRSHGRRWILIGGLVGMGLVFLGTALPFFLSQAQAADACASGVCEHCCPTLVADEDGGYRLNLPPASIVTFLGGALLVAIHLGNIRCCSRC